MIWNRTVLKFEGLVAGGDSLSQSKQPYFGDCLQQIKNIPNELRQVIWKVLTNWDQVQFLLFFNIHLTCQDLIQIFIILFHIWNNKWNCFYQYWCRDCVVGGKYIQLKCCHTDLLFNWQELSCSFGSWWAECKLINSLKMKLSITITKPPKFFFSWKIDLGPRIQPHASLWISSHKTLE